MFCCIACSHRRHGQDKHDCLVLSYPCRRCEHTWRQDKAVLSCLDPVFNLLAAVQSQIILRITENLEIGNWVETRQNCLVLSVILLTPPTGTRQDSLVLSVSVVRTSYQWFEAGEPYRDLDVLVDLVE